MNATRLAPLIALPLLLLAGCTAAPEPVPTAEGCTPATAEFSWERSSQGDNQPVGVQVVTFEDGVRTVESRNIAIEAFLQDPTSLDDLTDGDETREAGWMEALLTDVLRTGQVSSAFNTNPDLGTEPKTAIDDPQDGSYVVSVSSPQATIPFTISCDGEVVAGGALTSIDGFGTASVAYRCGEDYGDDPIIAAALEYCP